MLRRSMISPNQRIGLNYLRTSRFLLSLCFIQSSILQLKSSKYSMDISKPTFLLILSLLLLATSSTKIQCEYQPSSWDPSKKFKLSDRQLIVSTIYNMDVIVDSLDQMVSSTIQINGYWQADNARTMARFVKPGDSVLNIGSHIGLEALILGKVVGEKGRLFIMQPYSITHNMVLKNVYFNGLSEITTVYNVGASNKHSKGFISVSTANTGGSQIFTDESTSSGKAKTEEVEVDLVDNILPKDAVIDFALIDVERSEVECLQGMKQTILRSPNIVIMCEWSGHSYNSPNYRQKINQLVDWFSSLKFKFYRIRRVTQDCSPLVFYQKSSDYVKSMPDPADYGGIPDIFIIPGHIDPHITF